MTQNNSSPPIAKRTSWQNKPMPESRKLLTLRKTFTQEEYNSISRGLIPVAMEDKWFIFLEDNRLYFHRSWTGDCIYELQFKQNGGIYSVEKAWVNQHPEQYRNSDDVHNASLLLFLIDNLLLGKNTPFPKPDELPEEMPRGVYQHHIAGTGYAEKRVSEKTSLIDKIKSVFTNRR